MRCIRNITRGYITRQHREVARGWHGDLGRADIRESSNDVLENDQERKLQEHWQAAAGGVDSFDFVERHHLFV